MVLQQTEIFFLHLVGELLLYFCDKRFKLCETLHFWIFFSMFLLMLTPREWESHGNIFSVLYLRVLWDPIAGHKRHRAERAKRHSLHQESDIEEGRIQQLTKKTFGKLKKACMTGAEQKSNRCTKKTVVTETDKKLMRVKSSPNSTYCHKPCP